MRHISSILLALCASLLAPQNTANAQCAATPGTGCVGAPKLGMPAQVTHVAPGLVISGLFDGSALIPILPAPLGIACAPGGCVLAGMPLVAVAGIGGASLIFTVPNDPRLVGLS